MINKPVGRGQAYFRVAFAVVWIIPARVVDARSALKRVLPVPKLEADARVGSVFAVHRCRTDRRCNFYRRTFGRDDRMSKR